MSGCVLGERNGRFAHPQDIYPLEQRLCQKCTPLSALRFLPGLGQFTQVA
jgi:hypothetical protein